MLCDGYLPIGAGEHLLWRVAIESAVVVLLGVSPAVTVVAPLSGVRCTGEPAGVVGLVFQRLEGAFADRVVIADTQSLGLLEFGDLGVFTLNSSD